jgi:hypothetical protein
MSPQRQINAFTLCLIITALLSLIVISLCSGCGFLRDGIDVMIRPGGKLHETPKGPVNPAPPQPPPPKDDWAPPWFHRLEKERNATP